MHEQLLPGRQEILAQPRAVAVAEKRPPRAEDRFGDPQRRLAEFPFARVPVPNVVRSAWKSTTLPVASA
jgi:hypothetical protein